MPNFEDVAAFPLCWPDTFPRTPEAKRKNLLFKQSVYSATQNLMEELRKMGVSGIILSTSIPLRKDGLPLSKPPVDGDPGAAVYFVRKGQKLCLACDRSPWIEDNIQALAKTIEAMRGIERWGSSDLLDKAFTGFAALNARTPWWKVLGIAKDTPKDQIRAAYRALAVKHHPDRGGDSDRMAEINAAYEEAMK